MKNIKQTNGLTTISSSLAPLGSSSTLPLSTRITAQIELSRTNADLTLAQKATDLAIKEAGQDITKYILIVLLNEIEILTVQFSKNINLSKSEEKSNEAFINFQRIKNFIVKYYESHHFVFARSKDNIFEEMLIELICQYLKLDLKVSYKIKGHDESKVVSIAPLRKLISHSSLVLKVDAAIWGYYFWDAYNKLVTSVFWEIIHYRLVYHGPIEPENDPLLIYPDTITDLVTDFICNPEYTDEALNQIARKNIWDLSCMYSSIIAFNNKYDDYGPDEIHSCETEVTEAITALFKKLVSGKVQEKSLITAITKMVKENLSKE